MSAHVLLNLLNEFNKGDVLLRREISLKDNCKSQIFDFQFLQYFS